MRVYYNEWDKYCAQWLRNLMAANLIPAGDVDDRDIRDVKPSDLEGYDQCHFFAGIGGWPYALKLAGWPDERGVWTASCPCQPFSAAGTRKGANDDRHLWPALFRLISARRPGTIFGEQVASADVIGRIDEDVHAMWALSTNRELQEVLGARPFWNAPALQAVPAPIREALAFSVGGISEGGAGAAVRQGEDLFAGMAHEEPRGLLDSGMSAAVCQERNSLRPGSSPARNTSSDRRGLLRSDGLSVGIARGYGAAIQYAVDRQARSKGGLHLQQHQSCLFGDEHDARGLGRRAGPGAGAGMGREDGGVSDVSGSDGSGSDAEVAAWVDGVFDDLERDGYACFAADLTAAGVGAPHIRQRLFWVADAVGERWGREHALLRQGAQGWLKAEPFEIAWGGCAGDGMEHAARDGREQWRPEPSGRGAERGCSFDGMGVPESFKHNGSGAARGWRREPSDNGGLGDAPSEQARLSRFPWRQSESIPCADGKSRRIEPGTFPLAHGVSARVGKLRAYGNAIVPQVAAQFIEAYLEIAA